MSVAAVLLVKDEADILPFTLRHLLGQVDALIVQDNGSTDGTADIAQELALEYPGLVQYAYDGDPAYYQDLKTTALALQAAAAGHEWVLPCDADEYWYSPDGRPVRDWLAGLAPDVQVVRAELVNHLPTALDPVAHCEGCGDTRLQRIDVHDSGGGSHVEAFPCRDCGATVEPSPFRRLGWRLREPAPLGKVLVRAHPQMKIHMGNHGVWLPGQMLTVPGLTVRHYSWRSREQYQRKIRNGARAYAATDKPSSVGQHWRMFGNPPDLQAVGDHFDTWFFSRDPEANDSLIYDPAPFT